MLSIWFLLAFLRTIINLGKVIEDGRLFLVSDNQKREELLKCYPVVSFLKNKVGRNSDIALYTQDGACFFALQYYLYPARIYWDPARPISKNYKYSYVVLFYGQNTPKLAAGMNDLKQTFSKEYRVALLRGSLFENTKNNILGKKLLKTILIGKEKALIYK